MYREFVNSGACIQMTVVRHPLKKTGADQNETCIPTQFAWGTQASLSAFFFDIPGCFYLRGNCKTSNDVIPATLLGGNLACNGQKCEGSPNAIIGEKSIRA